MHILWYSKGNWGHLELLWSFSLNWECCWPEFSTQFHTQPVTLLEGVRNCKFFFLVVFCTQLELNTHYYAISIAYVPLYSSQEKTDFSMAILCLFFPFFTHCFSPITIFVIIFKVTLKKCFINRDSPSLPFLDIRAHNCCSINTQSPLRCF